MKRGAGMFSMVYVVLAGVIISLFIFLVLHTKITHADIIPLYAIVQDVSIVLDERNKTAELPITPAWAAIRDVDECVLYCETGSILFNVNGMPAPTDRAFHLYAQEIVVLPKEYLKTTGILLLSTWNGTARIRFLMLKKYPYKRRY